ncbi:MAG: hypothetical protein AB1445_00580 [Bacillota bacterium]
MLNELTGNHDPDYPHVIPFFEEHELPYLYEHWPEAAVFHRHSARLPFEETHHDVQPWPPHEENTFFWQPCEYRRSDGFPHEWRYPPS